MQKATDALKEYVQNIKIILRKCRGLNFHFYTSSFHINPFALKILFPSKKEEEGDG